MMRATYTIEVQCGFIFLVDLDQDGPSVTNDAENVIADLAAQGLLRGGRRVIYQDTMKRCDELLHDGQRFTGFRAFERA